MRLAADGHRVFTDGAFELLRRYLLESSVGEGFTCERHGRRGKCRRGRSHERAPSQPALTEETLFRQLVRARHLCGSGA